MMVMRAPLRGTLAGRRPWVRRLHRPGKSPSCRGTLSGRPLTEYPSSDVAAQAAARAKVLFHRELTPYRCPRCGHWHLSLARRVTPSTDCDACTSSNGRPKKSYASREDAERRADILKEERGADLVVYECARGRGWHLARRSVCGEGADLRTHNDVRFDERLLA